MAIAGVFPAVARDFVSAPDAAGGEYDGFGAKNFEAAALAFVTEGADGTIALFQDREDGVLHVDLDALMNAVILQSADHLETGAISHVGESRIFVTAEVSLQDAPVL